MSPIDAALEGQAAGFYVHWLDGKKLHLKTRELEKMDAVGLKTTYTEGLSPAVGLGKPIASDPFDTDPVDHGTLAAVFLEIHDKQAAAGQAEAELARRWPDYRSFPRIIVPNGFWVFFTTDRDVVTRVVTGSTQKCTGMDGKGRYVWNLNVAGNEWVALPPSVSRLNGKPLAWDGPTVFEAFTKNPDSLRIDSESLERLSQLEGRRVKPVARDRSDIDDLPALLDALTEEGWRDNYMNWLAVGSAVAGLYRGTADERQAEESWKTWTGDSHKDEDLNDLWVRFGYETVKCQALSVDDLYRIVKRTRPAKLRQLIEGSGSLDGALDALAKEHLSLAQTQEAINLLLKKSIDDGSRLTGTELKAMLKRAQTKDRKSKAYAGANMRAGLQNALVEYVHNTCFMRDGVSVLMGEGANVWVWRDGMWSLRDPQYVEHVVYEAILGLTESLEFGEEHYETKKQLQSALKEGSMMDFLGSTTVGVARTLLIRCQSKEENALNLTQEDGKIRPISMNCRNRYLEFDRDGTFRALEQSPTQNCAYRLTPSYDPDATCPIWLDTLDSVFGFLEPAERADTIRHLQEIVGYVACSSRKIDMFVFMYGAANSGKSLISRTVTKLLGTKNVDSTPVAQLDGVRDTHGTASVGGKRMLYNDDLQIGAVLPDGLIKQMGNEGIMTVNPKGGKKYNTEPSTIMWLLSNPPLSTRQIDDGIERRAHVFHFPRTIPLDQRDPMLQEALMTELPGILAWAVEGLSRLIKRRWAFSMPAYCTRSKEKWFNSSDSVRSFFTENYVATKDRSDRIKRTDIWEAFQAWEIKTGVANTGYRIKRKNLYDRFESLLSIASDGIHMIGVKRMTTEGFLQSLGAEARRAVAEEEVKNRYEREKENTENPF